MNPLLEKFEEYKSIVNYRFVYQFANGLSIEYKLRQADFPHLLGLHKLTDIPIIQQFRDVNQPMKDIIYNENVDIYFREENTY